MGFIVCIDLSWWMLCCKIVCFVLIIVLIFVCNMVNLFGLCRRCVGYCLLGIECYVIICNKCSINY